MVPAVVLTRSRAPFPTRNPLLGLRCLFANVHVNVRVLYCAALCCIAYMRRSYDACVVDESRQFSVSAIRQESDVSDTTTIGGFDTQDSTRLRTFSTKKTEPAFQKQEFIPDMRTGSLMAKSIRRKNPLSDSSADTSAI